TDELPWNGFPWEQLDDVFTGRLDERVNPLLTRETVEQLVRDLQTDAGHAAADKAREDWLSAEWDGTTVVVRDPFAKGGAERRLAPNDEGLYTVGGPPFELGMEVWTWYEFQGRWPAGPIDAEGVLRILESRTRGGVPAVAGQAEAKELARALLAAD